jgi:hypothetical protein
MKKPHQLRGVALRIDASDKQHSEGGAEHLACALVREARAQLTVLVPWFQP